MVGRGERPVRRVPASVDTWGVTERNHLRWSGPPSQRIVLVSWPLASTVAIVGVIVWALGSIHVGRALVAIASGVYALVLLMALVVERRERRRQHESAAR
jgi:hypothetical protein